MQNKLSCGVNLFTRFLSKLLRLLAMTINEGDSAPGEGDWKGSLRGHLVIL